MPSANIAELKQIIDAFNALLDALEAWQSHLQKEHASLSHRALPPPAEFMKQLLETACRPPWRLDSPCSAV